METPVILFYTEGKETYSVDAAGFIGRPAIGMKPSGGWRFVGIANHRGTRLATFPELVRGLISGGDLPERGAYVLDLDHGTHRSHGNKATRIWLAADHGMRADEVLELVERHEAERQRAEREAWEQRNAEARFKCDANGPPIYADERYNVALYRLSGEEWGIVDGETAEVGLTCADACGALGGALVEAAESA